MMNIFELLSFDISEFFASTEGKLIVAGIICLIIGIVFLCMGNGKNKKGNKGVEPLENSTTATGTPEVPSQNSVVETPVVNMENTPVVNQEPVILNNNMNTNQVQNNENSNSVLAGTPNVPPIEPINFGTQNSVTGVATAAPAVAPEPFNFDSSVASTPVEKLEVTGALPNMNNFSGESTIAQVNPASVMTPDSVVMQPVPTPTMTPESVVMEQAPVSVAEPVITPSPVTPISPVPEPIEQPAVTVYGGANPEVPKAEVLEEKPREIYGGANPLENTAPIPTNSVKEAYNGATITPVSSTPNVVSEPVVMEQGPTPMAAPVTPVQVQTVSEPVVTSDVLPEPAIVQPVPTPMVAPEPVVTPQPVVTQTPVTPASTVQSTPMAPRDEIERLEF